MAQSSAMHRFCRLPMPSYEKIFADANTILDEIISQFHTYRKPNQTMEAQNATILLKNKFAQVTSLYLPKLKGLIDEACVNNLVQFLLLSLTNSRSSLVSEFMKALSITLSGCGPYLSEDNLIQLLGEDGIVWLYLGQKDWIVKAYALQCIGNVCRRTSSGQLLEKQYTQICYSKLLDQLRIFLCEDAGDIDHLKLINIALKALQNVLSGINISEEIVEPEFAVTLLKIFLAYGMPGYQVVVERQIKMLPSRKIEDLETIEKIYPTKRKEKSTMTKKVHAKKTRKKKKHKCCEDTLDSVSEEAFNSSYSFTANWRQIAQPSSSSESEYSDSESGVNEHIKSILSKIRQNAAITIRDTLRCCDRRSKFSCWLVLVPDSIADNNPSLLHSLAMEPTVKIRSFVLVALMELIDGSKGFLESAVHSNNRISAPSLASTKPFTPYSVKLNNSIHILHDSLLTTLEKEQTDLEKDKVVKCLTLLMLNSPYKKIDVDYLPDIVRSVAHLLYSKEPALVQSTLTCLAASMSVFPENKEVVGILAPSSLPKKGDKTNDVMYEEISSWIVSFCLYQLTVAAKDSPKELRIASECIQLVTVILRCHPQLLNRKQRDSIIDLSLNVFMFVSDATISYHTIKLLEEFSKHFGSSYLSTKDGAEGTLFWKKMLSGAIPQYLHVQPEKPVKGQAAICDWLSNISSYYFDSLKGPQQIFVKTVLIGLASSELPLLSVNIFSVAFIKPTLSKDLVTYFLAAAVRALGVIIDYDCMKEDVWFVVDVTQAILQQLDNPSINVRLKAAWSLANLCDFIDKNDFLVKEYPESMVIQLFQYGTKAALDNEKVSSNGVRALGNLMKHLPRTLYDKDNFKSHIAKAIEALIKNVLTGPMKTRWNACYACKYMIENADCPLGESEWTADLFNSLLEALTECKNFKVRISAASALCSVTSRPSYGDDALFALVWRRTLYALEKSEELTDFTEFKHKDTLQDQTVIVLLHLLSLATLEDLANFRRDVQKHSEIFLQHCERCINIVDKETENCENVVETVDAMASQLNRLNVRLQPSSPNIQFNENRKSIEIRQHVDDALTNLCTIAKIDDNISKLDIIRTALHLMT